MRGDEKTAIKVAITVGIVSLMLYLPALECGFINLDDPYYITNNPLIKSLDSGALWRIFTGAHLGAWLPLTYVSFALDYHFWGENPTGYHLTNILLHAANAFLVVLLADRLLKCVRGLSAAGEETRGASGKYLYPVMLLLAGLFFAVHPMRVESVAWAAERKDVLNGMLTISAVLAYLGYVRRKEAGEGGRPWLPYLLALLLFALSLLAKQVSVTLPVILLLLDWFPLKRLRRGMLLQLLVEKIPFFAIALLITVMTIYLAAAEQMLISVGDMPFYVRALVSGNAIFEYCRLLLFPWGINPYFVLPKPLPYGYFVKSAAVAAATLFLLRNPARWPAVSATWSAFVILLLPMLAFVQSGDDIALAARYTYLPAIAPGIAAAAAVMVLSGKLLAQGRRFFAAAVLGGVAVFIAASIGITVRLISAWKDTGSFWTRVIEIEPVGRAYGDRGVFNLINGRSAAAVDDFTAAIAIAENVRLASIFNLYAFRGVALSDTGRFVEAIADLDRAIALKPHPSYFQQRGSALKSLGRIAEANEDFRRAGPNPPPIDWF